MSSLPAVNSRFGNILDTYVPDDSIRLIAALLYKFADYPNIEIESKFGLCINNNTMSRYKINSILSTVPLDSNTIISNISSSTGSNNSGYNFHAQIDEKMFKHLNERLMKPRYELEQRLSKSENRKSKLTYQHPKLEDRFYNINGESIRLSIDLNNQTNNNNNPIIVESIRKRKLEHLDFLNPNPQSLDFRVSVSEEIPINNPIQLIQSTQSQCINIRRKDRLQYIYQSLWSLDISRVESYNKIDNNNLLNPIPISTPTVSYEVELELIDRELVRIEAQKAKLGQSNLIVSIAENLLDNLKTISKYAFPNVQPPESCRSNNNANRTITSTNISNKPSTVSTSVTVPESVVNDNNNVPDSVPTSVKRQRTDTNTGTDSNSTE